MSDTVIYKRWRGMFRGMKMPVVTAVCFLFLISSCSGEGEYGTKISTEEQESEYSSVYAQVIEFSGFSNKEYQGFLLWAMILCFIITAIFTVIGHLVIYVLTNKNK